MEYTRNLNLPMLVPNQSGKEFTHNEALVIIDNFLNSGVKSITDTPPKNPIDGDKYIVGLKPENDFENKENQMAIYDNGWRFVNVKAGQVVWVIDEEKIYIFDGIIWKSDEKTDPRFLINNPQNNEVLVYDGSKFSNSDRLENLKKLSLSGDFILKNSSNIESYRLKNEGDYSIVSVSNDSQTWYESFSINNATGDIDFKSNFTKNGEEISAASSNIELIEDYKILIPTSILEFTNLNNNFKHRFIFEDLKGGVINGTVIYCQLGTDTDYIENYYNWSLYFCSPGISISSQQYAKISTSFQLVDSRYTNAGIKTLSSSSVEINLDSNANNSNEKYISGSVYTSIFNNYSDMNYFNTRCLGFVYNTEQVSKIKFFLKSGEFITGNVKHYILK